MTEPLTTAKGAREAARRTRIVHREYHDYSCAEETDMGVFESGLWKGQRYVYSKIAHASTPEKAEALLRAGLYSIVGSRTEDPDVWGADHPEMEVHE